MYLLSARFHPVPALFVLVSCLGASPALAAGPCTETARAALSACQHEAMDDYWISIGNCNNLSSARAKTRCTNAAKRGLARNQDECAEQSTARSRLCTQLGESAYDPKIDPSQFVDPTAIGASVPENPNFPLSRGRTWVYKGGDETITVTVTPDTRVIQGVTVAVVHDFVEANGRVVEETEDWFAQDLEGNVWYFGEIFKEYDEDGDLVSLDGSWKSGEDGAKAGIIMFAAPVVGDVYRQEFSLGNAEDMGQILSVTGSAETPAASCNQNCVVTKDFTPISPGSFEKKYYVPGIGLILEVDPESGDRVELVEVRD